MSAEAVSAEKYTFEAGFQTRIAACLLKDRAFNARVDGLIKPDYFEKDSEASVVNSVLRYYQDYSDVPTMKTVIELLNNDVKAKIIRKELMPDIKESLKDLYKEDISDVDFVADQVGRFARHKAMEAAAFKYIELVERGEYDKAVQLTVEASAVGVHENETGYDFFSDEAIADRERRRNEKLAGIVSKKVIPTGIRALDTKLYHGGWAKGEFYSLMGPPKSGKSISLAFFAKNAVLQGFNVLFATLEVSKDITADRMDSSMSVIQMKELQNRILEVKSKIEELRKKSGKLIIEERPTGTMTPNELKRIVQKYKSKGIIFDMIVVDYADIMAPNFRTNDPIENSRSIYIDIRAIGQIEDAAMLSAMQTNREGAKAVTAKMEHAAEDFNRIRIPDLVISINATEDERARNQARLFFVASRNQEGFFSIFIDQDLASMQFIKSVLKIE